MTTDLIERLREPWRADFALHPQTTSERYDVIYIQQLKKEAADTIESQAAEIEQLKHMGGCTYAGPGRGDCERQGKRRRCFSAVRLTDGLAVFDKEKKLCVT